MLASYFIHLANYNTWANQKLYSVCAEVGDNNLGILGHSLLKNILEHLQKFSRVLPTHAEVRE